MCGAWDVRLRLSVPMFWRSVLFCLCAVDGARGADVSNDALSPGHVTPAERALLWHVTKKFSAANDDWEATIARQDDITWKYFARSLVVLEVQVQPRTL